MKYLEKGLGNLMYVFLKDLCQLKKFANRESNIRLNISFKYLLENQLHCWTACSQHATCFFFGFEFNSNLQGDTFGMFVCKKKYNWLAQKNLY